VRTPKTFASQGDTRDKIVTFERLSDHAFAYTAEGDPNTGVIVGDDAVMVIDAQATPVMAQDVIRHVRTVTDKPIKYVVLSHYHAVRVFGASAYGAQEIIASRDTYDLIVERGTQDKASEIGRFPRLFRAVESIPPGLTWPTVAFAGQMSIWLGKVEVQLMQLGRGHTKGDIVAWLPADKVVFAGDLVEYAATPYAGDAYFTHWPRTLDNLAALNAVALVPGRGTALGSPPQVAEGIAGTRRFIVDMCEGVRAGVAAGKSLKDVYAETVSALRPRYGQWVIFDHCMPFDITRCYDEMTRYPDPRIWTADRDREMWESLEA
jgi:glyoxylase-like metal-dependent hydrolase (beta-lactamase superfamily II)